jgi:hypothetical protein
LLICPNQIIRYEEVTPNLQHLINGYRPSFNKGGVSTSAAVDAVSPLLSFLGFIPKETERADKRADDATLQVSVIADAAKRQAEYEEQEEAATIVQVPLWG